VNNPCAVRILCLLALVMSPEASAALAQSTSSDSIKDSPSTNKEKSSAAPNHIIFPTCGHKPSALYTDEAKAAKIQGSVTVEGIIGLDGRITNTRVVKGLGYGLDESALDSMKRWKCSPAIGPDGKPAPAKVRFQVNFKLY
jgi:TonB family protein